MRHVLEALDKELIFARLEEEAEDHSDHLARVALILLCALCAVLTGLEFLKVIQDDLLLLESQARFIGSLDQGHMLEDNNE